MAESEEEVPCKKSKVSEQPIIGFSKEYKLGMIHPHDDAKRVMVDQGSGADIMYPDLFKGLGLKLEDLDQHDAP